MIYRKNSPVAGEIHSLFLPGPAGRLEALLNGGEANATYAALLCHPHPMFGGTMHNKVVFAAMKALNSFGFPALRFNFRGAGLSEGAHDAGKGEQDDVKAALDWLGAKFHLPMIFTGFSFGAATGLRVCCPDTRVDALISLGTPADVDGRLYSYRFLADCKKPKLFVSGDRDQYGPREQVRAVVESAADPKELVFIRDADHFFEGKLDQLRAEITRWVGELVRV